ncbi:hypothetical protein EHF33_08510 [Deinococcus psychrotolerans]|uniref:MnmC-like methyltransferase domain-containing protein n=1 Tax=Deinococcus psychrotolerans TaxID=2489213 RepID=A0A3G8YCZ4_9DEIO|nr:tRNA (5-methylaminomethyl-2-thiouridine)(34)-methyltransferase MnmD [Deinococcus psychrotolerans]AZI42783.1 hypothetical protein EHF33_08510 [Deinococcus psychrotolerans]
MAEASTAERTSDGTLTLFSERYGEWYSSMHGAGAQSRTVFLEATGTHLHPFAQVLEIGFGLGLNFRTTLTSAEKRGAALSYLAYEAFPLAASALAQVAAGETHPLWTALLGAWDAGTKAGQLHLWHGQYEVRVEFADASAAPLPRQWASAIYLDGFSPTKNPEIWTPDFLARLADSLAAGGTLATYSAAGAVRRSLLAAGLAAKRRRGLVGKREFLVAHKP